jgi:hypothetical protein
MLIPVCCWLFDPNEQIDRKFFNPLSGLGV